MVQMLCGVNIYSFQYLFTSKGRAECAAFVYGLGVRPRNKSEFIVFPGRSGEVNLTHLLKEMGKEELIYSPSKLEKIGAFTAQTPGKGAGSADAASGLPSGMTFTVLDPGPGEPGALSAAWEGN